MVAKAGFLPEVSMYIRSEGICMEVMSYFPAFFLDALTVAGDILAWSTDKR